MSIEPKEQNQKVVGTTRAVCYGRVARPSQEDVDEQLRLNKAFAQDQGYDIVAAIGEWRTGTSMQRHGILRILEHVRQRDFDVLIIKDLKRLGSTLPLILPLLRSLREQGIRVESPMKGAGCDLLDSLPILRDLYEKGGGADGLV